MAFTKVGKVDEVPQGTTKVFEVGDLAVAVCNVDGQLYAVEDACTHDYGSFDECAIEGFEIECPRHGARFDVRTGEVKALPAVLPVDTFGVRVDGDEIEIEIDA